MHFACCLTVNMAGEYALLIEMYSDGYWRGDTGDRYCLSWPDICHPSWRSWRSGVYLTDSRSHVWLGELVITSHFGAFSMWPRCRRLPCVTRALFFQRGHLCHGTFIMQNARTACHFRWLSLCVLIHATDCQRLPGVQPASRDLKVHNPCQIYFIIFSEIVFPANFELTRDFSSVRSVVIHDF